LADTAHDFEFTDIDGAPLRLSDWDGKALLVVNTASKCGFTPQYGELQQLYDDYKGRGLVVLGVPSANFRNQEFADERQIKEFACERFAITFPLAKLTTVKGKDAHPFYQWARRRAGFLGSPKWNFHKYLIGKRGEFVTWFATTTSPTSARVRARIERELDK